MNLTLSFLANAQFPHLLGEIEPDNSVLSLLALKFYNPKGLCTNFHRVLGEKSEITHTAPYVFVFVFTLVQKRSK